MGSQKEKKYTPPLLYQVYKFIVTIFIWAIPTIIPTYIKCDNSLYNWIIYSISLIFWIVIITILYRKEPRKIKETRFIKQKIIQQIISFLIILFLLFTLVKWVLFIGNKNDAAVNRFYSLPLKCCENVQ